jgi:hypothetical protein
MKRESLQKSDELVRLCYAEKEFCQMQKWDLNLFQAWLQAVWGVEYLPGDLFGEFTISIIDEDKYIFFLLKYPDQY